MVNSIVGSTFLSLSSFPPSPHRRVYHARDYARSKGDKGWKGGEGGKEAELVEVAEADFCRVLEGK